MSPSAAKNVYCLAFLGAVLAFAAWWCLNQSMSQVHCILEDHPESGRTNGCYSGLEMLLEINRPARLRNLEGPSSLACLIVGVVLLGVALTCLRVSYLHSTRSGATLRDAAHR